MKRHKKMRRAKKPMPTHHKIILGLFLLLFAVLLQVGLSRHIFNFAGAATINDTPVTKKVYLLIFNPTITQNGTSSKLSNYMGWSDPDTISNDLVPVFPTVSNNYVNYTIAERIEVNGWPTKVDGYNYNQNSYLQCWQDHSTCHDPDSANFQKMFTDYNICGKDVDEVWVWGGPWFGYPEYQVVNYCGKSQFVMGYNYERGIAEALHDFGHRMEFIGIERINKGTGVEWAQDENSEWNKFSLIEGHCGNVHNPPSAPEGYNYGKTTPVQTDCNGYLNYPNGPYPVETITCDAWGCSQEGFMKWWLTRVPHNPGTTVDSKTGKTIYNNWWKYYAYYDETAVAQPTNTPVPNGTFSNVGATFGPDTASFNFAYSTTSSKYIVDVSTLSDMSYDVYLSFVEGTTSPLQVTNPQAKWDKYSCGRTLYWRVYNSDRSSQSPIQTTTVTCAVPTPTPTRILTPTPTRAATPTPTRVPTPTPTRVPTPTPSDTTPPTVVITSPANNSTIARIGTATIKATASDASGISKVEFYVNNSLKCTDTTASYSCSWFVITGRGTIYNLTAKAYDKKGNSKVSTTVRVTTR